VPCPAHSTGFDVEECFICAAPFLAAHPSTARSPTVGELGPRLLIARARLPLL
jgi:hypothetical protein